MALRRSVFLWVSAILFSSIALFAAKEFVKPTAEPANTYPSHDTHPNEKVTAAVDVYNAPPKSDIFSTNFVQDGVLPVFLIITNDHREPHACGTSDLTPEQARITRRGRHHATYRPHVWGQQSAPRRADHNSRARAQEQEGAAGRLICPVPLESRAIRRMQVGRALGVYLRRR